MITDIEVNEESEDQVILTINVGGEKIKKAVNIITKRKCNI